MPSQDVAAFLDALRAAGMRWVMGYSEKLAGAAAPHPLMVPLEDVEFFLIDPAGYERKRFEAWARFIEDGVRCRGTTRQGKRCGRTLQCDREDFVEGWSDYCDQHRANSQAPRPPSSSARPAAAGQPARRT